MSAPIIFSGNDAKLLKSNLDFGNVKILSGTVDPSSVATSAPIGSIYLNTTTGFIYKKKDAGSSTNWVFLTTSDNPQLKNYIKYPAFESNATTGWSLFNTTLTGVIPTGGISAGATSITTFAATATSPLAGLYSLNIASTGAITAGHGFISDVFTVDSKDQAKVLAFKFAYSVLSGATNLNFSGSSSNSWAVYIYDVTASQWIQPAGVYNLVQSAGAGNSSGTFQTTSNSTQYRLALVCVNATAGASSILFDDFYLGSQVSASGAAISDWTLQTGTVSQGFGTPTNVYHYYRIVGDSLEVRGSFIIGTVTANTAAIFLPPGMTIDANKIQNSTSTNIQVVGSHTSADTGAGNTGTGTNNRTGVVFTDSQQISTDRVFLTPFLSSSNLTKINGIAGWNTGASMAYYFTVPLAGKSSNSIMSADTDTRVCAASYYVSSNQAVGANGVINFDSLNYDTHGAVTTGSGWSFKAPLSGIYSLVSGCVETAGSGAVIGYLKNGVNIAAGSFISGSTNAAFTYEVKLNAGDTIQAIVNSATTVAGPTSLGQTTFINISRKSGPATIAATETVSARYTCTAAGQTVATGASDAVLVWNTKVWDTHGAVSGTTVPSGTGVAPGAGGVSDWRFTAPISGKFSVTAAAYSNWGSPTTVSNPYVVLTLYKNGSGYAFLQMQSIYGVAQHLAAGTTTVDLVAGDYIEITLGQGSGQTASMSSTPVRSWITIERVGN